LVEREKVVTNPAVIRPALMCPAEMSGASFRYRRYGSAYSLEVEVLHHVGTASLVRQHTAEQWKYLGHISRWRAEPFGPRMASAASSAGANQNWTSNVNLNQICVNGMNVAQQRQDGTNNLAQCGANKKAHTVS
jgi:hypothetical protein